MAQLGVLFVVVLLVIAAFKAFSDSGIELGAGTTLKGKAGQVTGVICIVLAIAGIWFAFFGLELLLG